MLYIEHETIRIGYRSEAMKLNYLLYMDDPKLVAKNGKFIFNLLSGTKFFFDPISFCLNVQKSTRSSDYIEMNLLNLKTLSMVNPMTEYKHLDIYQTEKIK